MMIIEGIVAASECSLLIPLSFAIREYKHWKKNITFKLIAVFLFLTLVQLICIAPHDYKLFTGQPTKNCIFFYNWQYVLTGFVKLGIFFTLLNFPYKKALLAFLTVILTGYVALEFKTDSLTYIYTGLFVTKVYLIVNLFVIALSLLYSYQLLRDLSVENITTYSFFWLNAGFLAYHVGSISVYSFVGNGATKQEAEIAWIVNAILLVFFYFTICLAYNYSKNLPQRS